MPPLIGNNKKDTGAHEVTLLTEKSFDTDQINTSFKAFTSRCLAGV